MRAAMALVPTTHRYHDYRLFGDMHADVKSDRRKLKKLRTRTSKLALLKKPISSSRSSSVSSAPQCLCHYQFASQVRSPHPRLRRRPLPGLHLPPLSVLRARTTFRSLILSHAVTKRKKLKSLVTSHRRKSKSGRR
jgi:hypothetical protein